MKGKKTIEPYFTIMTDTEANVSELFLYGVIGENWWSEDDSNTQHDFIKAFRPIDQEGHRINIRINSPGGSMYDGNAIITSIQNAKAEVHTYNDGIAASMGGGIWFSVPIERRHMAKNALLMLHSPSSYAWGNAKDLRSVADTLDKFEETFIMVMEENTHLDAATIKERYADYEDHWLTASEVLEEGFIPEIENYTSESEMPDNPTAMTEAQLIKFYAKKPKGDSRYFENLIRAMAKEKPKPITKNTDMNIEEFKASLEKGDLTKEEVLAAMNVDEKVEETPPTPEPVVEEEEDDTDKKIEEAVTAKTAELTATVEKLQATIDGFMAGAGAAHTPKGKRQDFDAKEEGELEAFLSDKHGA